MAIREEEEVMHSDLVGICEKQPNDYGTFRPEVSPTLRSTPVLEAPLAKPTFRPQFSPLKHSPGGAKKWPKRSVQLISPAIPSTQPALSSASPIPSQAGGLPPILPPNSNFIQSLLSSEDFRSRQAVIAANGGVSPTSGTSPSRQNSNGGLASDQIQMQVLIDDLRRMAEDKAEEGQLLEIPFAEKPQNYFSLQFALKSQVDGLKQRKHEIEERVNTMNWRGSTGSTVIARRQHLKDGNNQTKSDLPTKIKTDENTKTENFDLLMVASE